MAPHSSALAWKIPWMEEPGGLQSMGSLGVGHDWATSLHFSLSCIGEGNDTPLLCSCLENPGDRGAWWASVYGVTQSRTRLKRLSSSSSKVTWWVSFINDMRLQCLRNRHLNEDLWAENAFVLGEVPSAWVPIGDRSWTSVYLQQRPQWILEIWWSCRVQISADF